MVSGKEKNVTCTFSFPENTLYMLEDLELDLKLKAERSKRVKVKKSRILADLIRKEHKRHFKK